MFSLLDYLLLADTLAQYLSLAPVLLTYRGSIFVATCRASSLVNLEVHVMALRAVACALSKMFIVAFCVWPYIFCPYVMDDSTKFL